MTSLEMETSHLQKEVKYVLGENEKDSGDEERKRSRNKKLEEMRGEMRDETWLHRACALWCRTVTSQ